MENSEKIDKALDALLLAITILQRIAQMTDEEVMIRKREAEQESNELLKLLK